ncbi:MAG: glycoside hydrolase family 108 protein [Desulfomicrobium sp.]
MGFTEAHAFTKSWEGGLVDHPADPGGITNYGISLRFLRDLGHDVDGDGDVDANDIRSLTPETAASLFKEYFWTRPNLDDLPRLTACAHYDASVNMGIKQASKCLQQACNFYPGECLAVDGRIGPKTRARVAEIAKRSGDDLTLALRCVRSRKRFYTSLAAQKHSLSVFLRGWLNRCTALDVRLQALAKDGTK